MMEAANANSNITRLDVGIVSSEGLELMASRLANNKGLIKIRFEESKAIISYLNPLI